MKKLEKKWMSLMKKQSLILNNFVIILFFFSFSFSYSTDTRSISGKTDVIDGDTIKIKGQSIRLVGIDAPEKKQLCKKPYLNLFIFTFSKSYPCGQTSTNSLKKLINNQIILCKIEEKKDFFKRYLGTCFKDKSNINSWLVKNGHALAFRKYSKKYLNEELYAKNNKIGLWQGTFEMPWEWRKKNK